MAVIRNQDDATSVDLLVQELHGEPYDPILLYKRLHEVDKQYPLLAEDAFLLAIQTDFQRQMFEQYAHKVVCIDATHGTNAYRFKLITIMIVDDHGQGKKKKCNINAIAYILLGLGYPVAWCISSQETTEVVQRYYFRLLRIALQM